MKTVYITDDGKQFDNIWDCEEYEFILNHQSVKEIKFYDKNENELIIDETKMMESIQKVVDKAYKVIIPTEAALEDLRQYDKYCGFPCCYEENINGTGTWLYREPERFCDEGGFVRKGTKVKLFDIEWDTDYEDIHDLPTEVIIENPTREQVDAVSSYDDALADYLSDKYGYCLWGFMSELIEEGV